MKLRMPEMPPATLLAALGSYNLLPAIVFLPTRRRCDEAASEAALSRRAAGDERCEARRDFMRSLVEEHPEIRAHRHWDTIIRSGVAAHHAGHMPAWKLVIEKMMSAGLPSRVSLIEICCREFMSCRACVTKTKSTLVKRWNKRALKCPFPPFVDLSG